MYTVLEKIRTKITIKSSQFVCDVFPTEKVEEFSEIYQSIKKEMYVANHHCYAMRIGVEPLFQKYSDDGEPHGSAGKPMDMTLEKFSLTNIAVVVTRFFGGTKLGVGGLVRAYSDSVEESIKSSTLVELVMVTPVTIVCEYKELSTILSIFENSSLEQTYEMLEHCTLQFCFPTERMESIHRQIKDIQYIVISVQIFDSFYKTIYGS